MRAVLTGAGSDLGRKLAAALASNHDVLTTDAQPGLGVKIVADPRDPAVLAALLAGREAVIHLAAPGPGKSTGGDALDAAARGTYNLLLAAVAAGVQRFVLLSTLRLFDRYPPGIVVESYRPRPTISPADLAPYLAEVVAKEVTRVSPLTTVCLRLGNVVDDAAADGRGVSPDSVHLEDVAQAVDRALSYEPEVPWPGNSFGVYHIVAPGRGARYPLGAAGRSPFGYAPRHELAQDVADSLTREPEQASQHLPTSPTRPGRIVVYGAGGPLAAAVAAKLAADRMLRLTDVRPLAEILAAGTLQAPGAPIARPYGPPHEEVLVDVGDERQVVAAAAGMDAILNCSVIRTDPAGAFRVNLVGAYNVCRAAVANGIRRIVHTGPQQATAYARGLQGYGHDFGVVDDVPARPGAHLYLLTKYLGMEVCRIFAEERGLEVPALLFSSFVNPDCPPSQPHGLYPMSVSWSDAASAIQCALDVPFPPHLEQMHVLADLPYGQFTNEKAKRLLGWQPTDRLERHWQSPV